MAEAALEALSLLVYLWFLQFEQKAIPIIEKVYCKQSMMQILLLLHLLVHLHLYLLCATSIIYNAVFPIISIV